MKTFDIAVKYISDIDFKGHSLADLMETGNPEKQSIKDKLLTVLNKFLVDEQHYVSNETYWKTVFAVAAVHVNELQKGRTYTCFDIAKIVIEENTPPENSMYKGLVYLNTKYPKKMVDEWNAWCELQNPKEYYLTDSDMRFDIFTVAHAFIFDENHNNLPKGYLLD